MGNITENRMSDHDQLATDREVQNFKAALRVLLSDERLLQGGKEWETMVIDKCSVALNNLVELHYDKRHLLDVVRRQGEEIDLLRNRIRDTGTLINHLSDVKNTHTGRIEELTKDRDHHRGKNTKRDENVATLNKNIVTIKEKKATLVKEHPSKLNEITSCKT